MSSTLNLLQYNHNIVTTETEEQQEETLSNVLDTDLSNISETGKEYITTIGYPSSTSTSLTVGSSGASYTAPADGWVNFGKSAGGTGALYVYISSNGVAVQGRTYGSSTGYPQVLLPVCEGNTFTINYSCTGSGSLNFFYAEGAK